MANFFVDRPPALRFNLITPAEPQSLFIHRLDEIKTNSATKYARARASWGLTGRAGNDGGIGPDVAKPSQGPAPLRSQDSGRRLLPGQSRAGQGALPLPRWQIDGSEDAGGSCTYRRDPAPALARASREDSSAQK